MVKVFVSLLLFLSLSLSAQNYDTLMGTAVKVKKFEAARSHIVTFEAKNKSGIVFDADTMRFISAWTDGNIQYKGLPFTGAHGPSPSIKGKPLFYNEPGPGYAKDGSFNDPRSGSKPFLSRLPDDWAKFKGIYRNGKDVVFSYTVNGSEILDMPQMIQGTIVRTIENPDGATLNMAVATGEAEVKGDTAYIDGCAFSVSQGEFKVVNKTLTVSSSAKRFHLTYSKAADISGAKKFKLRAAPLTSLTKGGPSQWPKVLETKGKKGKNDGAFAVDNIAVPYNNEYDPRMRISAFDFFKNGTTAAVSTWDGSIWIVENIDADLNNVKWKKFAAGLHEPMGLKIVDDKIYTVSDDQITRFHDLNNDGEADFYECFNNDWELTSGFHAFCFDLQTDKSGNFYFAFGAPVKGGGRSFERLGDHHGSILRVSADGKKLDRYATGFRAPNGIGISPAGQITAGDNEGTFMPRSPIHWVDKGYFGGVVDTYEKYTDLKTTATVKQRSQGKAKTLELSEIPKPLAWLPKKVDNSGGGQVWVTSEQWSPLKGELLHLSYGRSALYLVLKEKKGGQMQGGVVKFPVRLTSSAMRARFNDKDGQLYIAGLKGWQTNAAKNGGLDRIRYTGKALNMLTGYTSSKDGLSLTFSEKLDAELANDPTSYALKGSDIHWTHAYGSKDYSLGQRGTELTKQKQGWTSFKVTSAKLRADGKTVDLKIDNLQPAHQMELSIDVESDKGDEIIQTFWFTIHSL